MVGRGETSSRLPSKPVVASRYAALQARDVHGHCGGGCRLALKIHGAATSTKLLLHGTRRPKPFSPLRPDLPQLVRIFQTASSSRHTPSSPSSFSLNASRRSIPPSTTLGQKPRVLGIRLGNMGSTRAHSKHSHGLGHHHHHGAHDNVYLTSTNKHDAGVRITRIGLYSNLGMVFAKGLGGIYFGSQAMVADAWHSMTDLASDVLTLATVSWSLRPPTPAFPTGFGKVESLGSLGVSGMLLGGGIFMCMSSVGALAQHLVAEGSGGWIAEALSHLAGVGHSHGHGHGHDHGHGHGDVAHIGGPSLHAAWLAASTVAVKEWLYHASKFSNQTWRKARTGGFWGEGGEGRLYSSCVCVCVCCGGGGERVLGYTKCPTGQG